MQIPQDQKTYVFISAAQRSAAVSTPTSSAHMATETPTLSVATTVEALETVAKHFKALHPSIQQHVLQSSLAATIAMLTSPDFLKGAAGPRPYQLYQR